jgi:hypothetical protein
MARSFFPLASLDTVQYRMCSKEEHSEASRTDWMRAGETRQFLFRLSQGFPFICNTGGGDMYSEKPGLHDDGPAMRCIALVHCKKFGFGGWPENNGRFVRCGVA